MSMSSYLVVAEVDKIQSFIFRSSKLKEVVGASYILTKFCEDVSQDPSELSPKGISAEDKRRRLPDVLTSGGGSFRLVYDDYDKEEIGDVKRNLKRLFDEKVGGSITIVSVPYDDSTPEASENSLEEGRKALIEAKQKGRSPAVVWHMPYHAICASCGVELAIKYKRQFDDEPEKYICKLCQNKAEFAHPAYRRKLFKALLEALDLLDIDEEQLRKATDAEMYAEGWDRRNYVAYLVADGNNMGKIFSACPVDRCMALSAAISDITTKALATAIDPLIHLDPKKTDRLPALPLILGGDDVFVLMPAPWAFDVARVFAAEYETLMNAKLQSLEIEHDDQGNPIKSTIGVAMVICKASYPYRHAHEHGHALLDDVKDEAKERNESMIVVDWIVGSDTVATGLANNLTLDEAQSMTHHRFAMRSIPTSFLHQLQEHLHLARRSDDAALREFLNRRRRSSPRDYEVIENARADLDGKQLLQLLRLWEFAYDTSHPQDEYDPQEELA